MGFFNAAFRLGAVQGFQNRMEEIAEEQEKLLEEDKKLARKASATMASVVDKRKRLRQNRENIFAIIKGVAPEGADEKAIKNLFKQKENTDGSPINEGTARRLLESMTADQINAFTPAEEPAIESPPKTEEEESGPGFLASVFSPSARRAAAQRELFKKPPGASDAEWKAALAEQDIPVYQEPTQPVRSFSYTTGADRNYIKDTMTEKKENITVKTDRTRFKNLWTDIGTWMTGGTVYDTYYRKNVDRLVADVDDLDAFLKGRGEKKPGTDRLTPKEIEKIKKIGIQEFLKDADEDADPAGGTGGTPAATPATPATPAPGQVRRGTPVTPQSPYQNKKPVIPSGNQSVGKP
jgi:hypothetical protein